MRTIPAAALFALTIGLPSILVAQEPPKHDYFYVGGAIEADRVIPGLDSRWNYGPTLGFSLRAGYGLQSARWSYSVDIAYHERSHEFGPFAFGSDPGEFQTWYHRSVAVTLDVTYDLSRGGVRPYLIGGVGLYRASVTSRNNSGERFDYSQLGLTVAPGVGLRIPLGRTEAFTEWRWHLSSASSRVVWPLTFGLRF
ncbi:MAG: outer membrane beta-barrel protein [Gemmatimonadales bacterium]